ncbi:MAG TPA: hypothetical protein DCR55_04700, partial [Lentisphaeria bacterium]|nr:hypothetical protein [Lentisphaeria bacterium]
MKVAQLLVDVSLDRHWDYGIPEGLEGQVAVGALVQVIFNRRECRGYVVGMEEASTSKNLSPIL